MAFDEQKHIDQLVYMYEKGFTNILWLLQSSPDNTYYRDILADIRGILKTLDKDADKNIKQLISQAYSYNASQTMAFLKSLGKQQKPGFAQIHQRAVDVLAQNLSGNLRNATQYVGRRVNDIFSAVALETAGEKYVMGATIGDMRDNLINRLVDEGYTAFVDRLGREWRLDTYASMVARTITREAASVAVLNECEEFDVDLVMFSTHKLACELCQTLQGKVYSISGNDKRYPKLTDEIRPPVHPNCRHSIQPYIKELDDNAEETERRSWREIKPDAAAVAAYTRTQKAPGAVEEILRNPQIQQFDLPLRRQIEQDLRGMSPEFLKVIQKSLPNVIIQVRHDNAVSCYHCGVKKIELQIGQSVEDTARSFWHEYGHFVDDISAGNGLTLAATSKSSINKNVLPKFYKLRYDDATHFINNAEYEISNNRIYYKGRRIAETPAAQDKLLEKINDKIAHDIGRDAAEEYLEEHGIPKNPNMDDFYIFKPDWSAEEKYPGAAEEYNNLREKYLQALKNITPEMQRDVERLRQEYERNKIYVGGITDSLDALVEGDFNMQLLWGGHSADYYQRYPEMSIVEIWANWFQAHAQRKLTHLYTEYMPNIDKELEAQWEELLKATFGGE